MEEFGLSFGEKAYFGVTSFFVWLGLMVVVFFALVVIFFQKIGVIESICMRFPGLSVKVHVYLSELKIFSWGGRGS